MWPWPFMYSHGLCTKNLYISEWTCLLSIMTIHQQLVQLWPKQVLNHKNLTFDLKVWPWPSTYSHAYYTLHVYISEWSFLRSIMMIHKQLLKLWLGKGKNHKIWPLTSTCDLDLRHTMLQFIFHTPIYQSEHFYEVSWQNINNLWRNGPDKVKIPKFWPLTSKCDLDLWCTVTVCIREIITYQSEYFY